MVHLDTFGVEQVGQVLPLVSVMQARIGKERGTQNITF